MAYRKVLWAALLGIAGWMSVAPVSATPVGSGDSAVVLMYHRFGESEYPSTSVTLEQFDAHIGELTNGSYNVMALGDIVDALQNGTTLPDRAVAISIDDAYLSVYREAWPRLKKAGLPFTVFVATDDPSNGSRTYMSWDHVRELADNGVTIGAHTAAHGHMPTMDAATLKADMDRSEKRFEKELGFRPTLFAYPYGESSAAIQQMIKTRGYKVAFGQHSGAIHRLDNPFYYARFALNEKYGDLKRLRLVANTLAIPISAETPTDPMITDDNPPAMGFTVDASITNPGRMGCYVSHEGKAQVEQLGDARIEIRVQSPFPKGRTRLNCTMSAGEGRWRWLGRQFYRPE